MKNNTFGLLFILFNFLVFQESFANGSLAIDKNKGSQYGWAVDYPTIQLAEKRALEECGKNCYIVFSFDGGAAAYAVDQSKGSNIWSWGRADSAVRAKQIALEEAKSRGAKNPIIRVWAQESKDSESKSTPINNDQVKVFVNIKIDIENGKDMFSKGGWAQVVGWTYATHEELLEYGLLNTPSILYSKKVTGKVHSGTYLTTPRSFHTPDNSPIIKRFVNNVIHKHPIYNFRKKSEYHKDIMKMWSHDKFNFFGYNASIIIMNNSDMTYEQLKSSATYYEQKNGGYTILDLGGF
ncbi:DUF4189 domain-containing protein [Shewanella sp. MF05960]|uniref:DUF4189 domain-containing protein n=1 Tax=Shewanella sp. MF05960 TaxID=3434874 RepID=UPI003D78B46C